MLKRKTFRWLAAEVLSTIAVAILTAPLEGQAYQIVPAYGKKFPVNLKPAVQYAVTQWNSWLTTSGSGGANTLEITFNWRALGSGVLGEAGPSWVGFAGGLALLPAQYMIQTGSDPLGGDGTIALSSQQSWYGGTDGHPGSSQFDVVSVVLHELGHQMGMYDSYDGSSWGYPDRYGNYYLTRWDTFLRDQNGHAPVAYPAADNFNETAPVTFTGPQAVAANGGNPVAIYAPNPYQAGSSLAHVYQAGESDAMMYPFVAPGQARYGLYDYERGAFTDLGWSFVAPTAVHAVGYGGFNWNNGSAWQGGLPPLASTMVYLDAAVASAYSVYVRKSASAPGVVLSGPATLDLRAGTLNVGAGTVSFTGQATLAMRGGGLTVGALTVGDGAGSPLLSYENSGGSLAVNNLLSFGGGGRLSAPGGATIRMRGALDNHSTQPLDLAGLAHVALIFEGGPARTSTIEVAGKDMGAAASGWTDNFALGALVLGGADLGRIQLVNTFVNQPGWTNGEAIYVSDLVINPGAAIDAGSLGLYYLNGGAPKKFFNGDANLDGDVGLADYQDVEQHFGTTAAATWQMGDFDGDRQVTFNDYQILESHFGQSVPEPGALATLLLGGLALLKRMRKP